MHVFQPLVGKPGRKMDLFLTVRMRGKAKVSAPHTTSLTMPLQIFVSGSLVSHFLSGTMEILYLMRTCSAVSRSRHRAGFCPRSKFKVLPSHLSFLQFVPELECQNRNQTGQLNEHIHVLGYWRNVVAKSDLS